MKGFRICVGVRGSDGSPGSFEMLDVSLVLAGGKTGVAAIPML